MKLVSCKNCGAKYRLEDYEDISKFECSKCFSPLELDESSSENIKSFLNDLGETDYEFKEGIDSLNLDDDEEIVYCVDCNLRFVIDNKNIDDYLCSNCNGKLKFLNERLNKEHESSKENYDILPEHDLASDNKSSLKPIDMIDYDTEPKIIPFTQVDEDELKKTLKDSSKKPSKDIITKKKISKYNIRTPELDKKQIKNRKAYSNPDEYPYIYIIWTALLFISVGVADLLITIRIYSLIFTAIFLAIFIYLIVQNQKWNERKELENIFAETLSTLPMNYFILSGVKVPESDKIIDHIVVGSTGIFSVMIRKYSDNHDYPSEEKEIFGNELSPISNEDSEKITDDLEFKSNAKIKKDTVDYAELLFDYLIKEGFNEVDIIPLVAFVNKKVAILNNPLSNEDIFLDEFLLYIKNQDIIMDENLVYECALTLAQFAESSDV